MPEIQSYTACISFTECARVVCLVLIIASARINQIDCQIVTTPMSECVLQNDFRNSCPVLMNELEAVESILGTDLAIPQHTCLLTYLNPHISVPYVRQDGAQREISV